ncbi:MAG: DUF6935 domain-containing protein [Promethearchaeota archaeon]
MDVKTLEDLVSSANDSPENAIKFILDCLYVYQEGGDDKALGYMGYVLSKSYCEENMIAPCGYVLRGRYKQLVKDINHKPNCIVAMMGASWEDDYKGIDPDNYDLKITKKDGSEKQAKVFIKSGGRDNPVPITCKVNKDGKWKITDGFPTILMDVRKPKSDVDDF